MFESTEFVDSIQNDRLDGGEKLMIDLASLEAKGPLAEAESPRPIRHPSVLKRAIDVTLSVIMLVATFPLFALVSLAIWLEDRGPVLYRQERWGMGTRPFTLLKFRSMVQDADQGGPPLQASEEDERLTRVGRALRRFGLDELPQLVNILKGDMSFVGPRALAVGEVVEDWDGRPVNYPAFPGFRQRLAVRPGLTGVATIYLPKDATPMEKFQQDVAYVAQQSVWLDLKLIALSFWISVRGKWETRSSKI